MKPNETTGKKVHQNEKETTHCEIKRKYETRRRQMAQIQDLERERVKRAKWNASKIIDMTYPLNVVAHNNVFDTYSFLPHSCKIFSTYFIRIGKRWRDITFGCLPNVFTIIRRLFALPSSYRKHFFQWMWYLWSGWICDEFFNVDSKKTRKRK